VATLYSVYAEDCLTARSLAETLVISALLFHFYNRKTIAFLIAIAAFFVHPIMALPGMLVLVCLGSSLRTISLRQHSECY